MWAFPQVGTHIEFQLGGGETQHVTLKVYNVLGQEVRTLTDASRPPGKYRVAWDGTDDLGHAVPTGVYLYVLRTGRFVQSRRMLLMW
jgi:hypothetical protein